MPLRSEPCHVFCVHVGVHACVHINACVSLWLRPGFQATGESTR